MTEQTEQTQPLGDPPAESRRVVNWRSLQLRLMGVFFICSITAHTVYILGNTYLVGNFLPIGLMLCFMVLNMLINAPLHKWIPRQAFSSAELADALGMTLVSCT